jgi:zinc protease
VTRTDVLRVAQERFRAENLSIVAVGNAKDLGKPLTALNGKVITLDLTIPEPKAETPAKNQPTPQSIAQGKQLLARMQQAMGGSDKLAAIKDSSQSLEMAMDPSAGGLKLKQTVRFVVPNHYRQDQELPFGKVIAYTNGTTGWLSSPMQGVMAMPPDILKQAQGELFRRLVGLVLSDRDNSRTVSAVMGAGNTVEIDASDGQSVQLEMDPSTGLPAKVSYKAPGMGGAMVDVAQIYSDWRDASGFKMPYNAETQQAGKKVSTIVVTDYKFNTGLTEAEISKRP